MLICLQEAELEQDLTVHACSSTGQHRGPDIQCNRLQMMAAYPGVSLHPPSSRGVFPTTGPPVDLLLVVEGHPDDLVIATTLPVLGRSVVCRN